MKKQFDIFLTAIQFYTRIPVPRSHQYSSKNLNKATRYFPFIGWLVGGVGALLFWLSNQVLTIELSILISLVGMIMLTGAFHEDAISDFCDGFGGGYSKEQILKIMKDSRIGTYGAIGLIVLLLSKFLLLKEIGTFDIPIILIVAHALSRLNPVLLIFTATYVRDDDYGKAKPVGQKNNTITLILAILFGLMPLALIDWEIIPILLVSQLLLFLYFRYYVRKKVGGYTGDILGALQQLSEVCFYLIWIIAIQLL